MTDQSVSRGMRWTHGAPLTRWKAIVGVVLLWSFLLCWLSIWSMAILMTEDGESFVRGLTFPFVEGGEIIASGGFWLYAYVPALILTLMQVVFLVPAFRKPAGHMVRGKSLTFSLIIIGMFGGLGGAGLTWAVVSVIFEYELISDVDDWGVFPILIMLVLSWVFWTLVLCRATRNKKRDDVLTIVLRRVVAGTILEVIVVLPLDIMIRRRTDCYCSTGSFWTLSLAVMRGWRMLGPGIVLALTSRERRMILEQWCLQCGYEKGPNPGSNCPECGDAWSVNSTPLPCCAGCGYAKGPNPSSRCPEWGRAWSPRLSPVDDSTGMNRRTPRDGTKAVGPVIPEACKDADEAKGD